MACCGLIWSVCGVLVAGGEVPLTASGLSPFWYLVVVIRREEGDPVVL